HLDHTRREHRIDWTGAAMLVVGLVPLLIIAEQGRTWGWASTSAYICYLLGAVGLVAFIRVEARMGDEALLPLRLFRRSVFATGSAQALIVGMGMFGGIASIPLYLQIVKGASPTKAGLLLLPLVAGMMLASLASGQYTSRTGRYKIFPVVGSVLMVIGIALMTRIGADTPLWQTDIYMALFGMGLGMNMQSIVLAMQNSVDPRDMGVATSAVTFFRQVGGSLGTAVFLSILFTRAATNIPREYARARATPDFQQAAAAHPDQVALLNHGGSLNDTSFIKGLDNALAHPFLVGFSDAMDTVFLVGALVLVVGVVLSAMMKEVPLRSVSGQQARAAAERANEPETTSAASAAAAAAPADVAPLATGAQPARGGTES
ncbi:MAG: hypothetical protein QOI15_3150, partial [Pseudonocardiales bacterium]|nr:hypothetical protein [Pseudonocardiales bacterium]